MSPNVAFVTHQEYGAVNCLQVVNMDVVHTLKEELGGSDLVRFVSCEYATHCQTILDTLGVCKLTLQNVWVIFNHMLPLV